MPKRCFLYYITDRTALAPDEASRRKRLLEKIAEAARSGVDYIQLREKDLSTRALETLSRKVVGLLKELQSENPKLTTNLLINSRTDVALAVEADGVHLRSEDISPAEVRNVWQRGASAIARVLPQPPLIGVSCHTTAEVLRAEADGASFAVFAPVFEKKDLPEQQPAGLTALHQACRARIPVLALGGVTPANARQCLEAGAAGIAAIRLFQENEIATTVAHLRGSL
jgi:thiamine-phosphate pyrophosphorylase